MPTQEERLAQARAAVSEANEALTTALGTDLEDEARAYLRNAEHLVMVLSASSVALINTATATIVRPEPMTLDVPGAFECFFTGSGAYAGDPYSNDPEQEQGARDLVSAWKAGRTIRRGKGYSIRVELPTVHAALVLAEYAEACLTSNYGGDVEHSEVRAAKATLERIEAATSGRVTYDGWNVRLDGERVT